MKITKGVKVKRVLQTIFFVRIISHPLYCNKQPKKQTPKVSKYIKTLSIYCSVIENANNGASQFNMR